MKIIGVVINCCQYVFYVNDRITLILSHKLGGKYVDGKIDTYIAT